MARMDASGGGLATLTRGVHQVADPAAEALHRARHAAEPVLSSAAVGVRRAVGAAVDALGRAGAAVDERLGDTTTLARPGHAKARTGGTDTRRVLAGAALVTAAGLGAALWLRRDRSDRPF